MSGGWWTKTEHGWKWCSGNTFPRPGGDWTGELIPPGESRRYLDDYRDYRDDDVHIDDLIGGNS